MAQLPDDRFSRRALLGGAGGGLLLSGLVPRGLALSFEPWQPTTDKLVRIGIIGGNFGASFQWHEHPNCKVTAVCDLRDHRIAHLRKVYNPEAAAYKDYRELLADKNVDAVGVYTPAPLHVEMATTAMQAGKHVISAVPAALDLPGCQTLIDTQKKTGMNYMMAETSYYRYQMIAARQFAAKKAFGTLFYTESEYHHEGLINLWFEDERGNYCMPGKGKPTWRQALPPMLYPTHCLGMTVPVTGERMVEVTCIGWGNGDPAFEGNPYHNPFWNEQAFFKTSGGHSCRVSICWHMAAGGGERGTFYGDKMSLVSARPEGSGDKLGYPQYDPRYDPEENRADFGHYEVWNCPDYFELLPPPLRHATGHGNSHAFITHEFVMSILEERPPEVDVYEAVAYTAPGIVAHESAMKGGETLEIPQFA